MDFGNLRETSVKIGKDLNGKNNCECLPESVGYILLEVVIRTTAKGMQPTFSGRHTQLFIISDLNRLLTEIVEVHTDIARSILKSIISVCVSFSSKYIITFCV